MVIEEETEIKFTINKWKYKDLNKILKGSFINFFPKEDKENFEDLLEKMLCFHNKKRINAEDALIHKFFQ